MSHHALSYINRDKLFPSAKKVLQSLLYNISLLNFFCHVTQSIPHSHETPIKNIVERKAKKPAKNNVTGSSQISRQAFQLSANVLSISEWPVEMFLIGCQPRSQPFGFSPNNKQTLAIPRSNIIQPVKVERPSNGICIEWRLEGSCVPVCPVLLSRFFD